MPDRLLPTVDGTDAERLAAWLVLSCRIAGLLRHADAVALAQLAALLQRIVRDLDDDLADLERRT